MDSLHLSPRLSAVANYVPENARLADIGSDHGYLPANLLINNKINFAVIGEVASGPLANARHELSRRGLLVKTILRLADGLSAIEPQDAIDTVVIAGMGGMLITTILNASLAKHNQYKTLILQPNTDEDAVRKWLIEHNYKIENESIVQEDKHFYEVIVAIPGESQLTDDDVFFGPFLRLEKSSAFVLKWQKELSRIHLILDKLNQADKNKTPIFSEWENKYAKIQEEIS